jgi:glycosyltransferase involved in cell wall biosynthesis
MSVSLPLVSIGMSVRNCESTLKTALESILQQTYANWELLLLDDGSHDGTVNIARQFNDSRIRLVVDGKNLGLATRLNQAVELAKGTYFARMDGDDVSYPGRLERQVGMLETNRDTNLVGCGAIVFDSKGEAVGRLPLRVDHEEICARPWAGFYLAHPTWMGQIDWFRKHPYRQDALRGQDQDLLLRTYRESRFAALPEILLGYRQETLSLSRILRGRYHFSRALLRQFVVGRDWRLARGLIEQPAKALFDLIAVGSGLNYRLLRHRALPIDDAQRAAWKKVWVATTAGDSK